VKEDMKDSAGNTLMLDEYWSRVNRVIDHIDRALRYRTGGAAAERSSISAFRSSRLD